ncbi:MAG: hydrogenase [Sulfurospirillum sp.]|nr:hydrogenase [Sulfurospirillum sp.]
MSEKLGALLHIIGALFGLGFVINFFQNPIALHVTFPFSLLGQTLVLHCDALSAFFLLSILLISSASCLYGLSYYSYEHRGVRASWYYRLLFGLFTFSMVLLVISDSFMLFLLAWEMMSLLAYGLISIDEDDKEANEAGFIYIIATHTGVIALLGVFGLLYTYFGVTTLSASWHIIDQNSSVASIIFLLGLFGFGLKAGIFPLYFWLPSAHANAPVSVSALLSGVMIKMGIFGILRICLLFAQPPHWWGWLLFIIGIISGLLGVIYAIAQHDIKRLLAYHSIENIGIIMIGIGMAMLGQSYGNQSLMLFGIAGAVFHVLNHSLFKPLLFYSAGSVIEAFHTRNIAAFGGILRVMPYTALFFLIGAVAIVGIAPLNGFASEWLLYLGMFKNIFASQQMIILLLGILGLATIGTLALACFIKVFGATFLGTPRDISLEGIHESSRWMLLPMGVIAFICIVLGLMPFLMMQMLFSVAVLFGVSTPEISLLALQDLSEAYLYILPLAVVVITVLWLKLSKKSSKCVGTWGCGYHAPPKRAQYTAGSLAQMLLEYYGWMFKGKRHLFEISGLFPKSLNFHLHFDDKNIAALNFMGLAIQSFANRLRAFVHNGYMGLYVLYILATLIVMLLYVSFL